MTVLLGAAGVSRSGLWTFVGVRHSLFCSYFLPKAQSYYVLITGFNKLHYLVLVQKMLSSKHSGFVHLFLSHLPAARCLCSLAWNNLCCAAHCRFRLIRLTREKLGSSLCKHVNGKMSLMWPTASTVVPEYWGLWNLLLTAQQWWVEGRWWTNQLPVERDYREQRRSSLIYIKR